MKNSNTTILSIASAYTAFAMVIGFVNVSDNFMVAFSLGACLFSLSEILLAINRRRVIRRFVSQVLNKSGSNDRFGIAVGYIKSVILSVREGKGQKRLGYIY